MLHKIRSLWNEYTEVLERIFFWGWEMRRNYDFDFSGMYRMLHVKIQRMYVCNRDYGHHICSHKYLRKMQIAAELAKRLHEEDYEDPKQRVLDKAYFFKLLEKHLDTWWD